MRITSLPLTLLVTAALAPTPAFGWGVVLVENEDPQVGDCVNIQSHTIDAQFSETGATSVSELIFRSAETDTAWIIVPELNGTPKVTFNGEELTLDRLDVDAASRFVMERIAERPTPALLSATGLPLHVRKVSLTHDTHELRIESSAFGTLDGATSQLILPMRHMGSACYTPSTAVRVRLAGETPIGAVFTPYHDRTVTRVSDTEVIVDVTTRARTACNDLHMYVSRSDLPVTASVLSYRNPSCTSAEPEGDLGYMLVAAGATVSTAEQAVAKDISMVIDTSGSMGGEKIRQVREALQSILQNLAPTDRYNLVTFAGSVNSVFGQLVDVSDAQSMQQAMSVASSLPATGSTNINDALLTALDELGRAEGDRPRIIIFLTDGEATAGERDTTQIVNNVVAANELEARIFSFGVGHSVNTRLLDELARRSGGEAHYIQPGADIDAALANFYSQIQAPIATDVELVSEGVTLMDRYPAELPDLYVGSDFYGAARYSAADAARLTLFGKTETADATFPVDGTIAARSARHAFLPRLWASRRLGELLYEARQNGGEEATVDQIRELAGQHGFITPWTPFVTDESGEVNLDYRNPTGDEVGSEAVATSGATNDLAGNSNAGAYSASEGSTPIVQVLDRTLIREHGYWVDTRVAHRLETQPVYDIQYMGPGWRQLASVSPEIRTLLSTARSMTFEWRCQIVRVTDPVQHEDAPHLEESLPADLLANVTDVEPLPIPAGPPPARGGDNGPELAEAAGCACDASHEKRTSGGWFGLALFAVAIRLARRRRTIR